MAKHILIRKIWETGFGQKHVTIPNDNPEGLVAGDIVVIKRATPKIIEGKCRKCKKLYSEHTVKELYDHKLIERVV